MELLLCPADSFYPVELHVVFGIEVAFCDDVGSGESVFEVVFEEGDGYFLFHDVN